LGLVITELKSFKDDSFITVTLNFINYAYLTNQDQLHLLLCIQGLSRDNKDSDCHGLRFPSVTSLTVAYYPHIADTLYKIKRVLPNLERVDIGLLINHWNQFNSVMESLSFILPPLNLKVAVYLGINIDRCSVKDTRISLYTLMRSTMTLYHYTTLH
jgi:hypothetical protein